MQAQDVGSNRVLCITFDAPPTSLGTLDAASTPQFKSESSAEPSLFWNFLLAHPVGNELLGGHVMADVMAAVMATVTANIDYIERWLGAVTDVMAASSTDGVGAANEVRDSLRDLWIVGTL